MKGEEKEMEEKRKEMWMEKRKWMEREEEEEQRRREFWMEERERMEGEEEEEEIRENVDGRAA